MRTWVIGTRGSQLALAQTNLLCEALKQAHPDLSVRIEIIKTKGDKFLELSLTNQPDKGLFTREIEQRLLDKTIDIAVHSLKDLPVVCVPGTMIGAYMKRAATEDVLIGSCGLDQLPPGAVVGTSSKRRAFQLLEAYPHLQVKEIRGNVETRIAKMRSGQYDAILMARAGLERLNLTHEITEIIPEEVIVPAPGQAAIAIHIRQDEPELLELLRAVDDKNTRFEVEFERDVLHLLGGGCAMPLGCVCHKKDEGFEAKAYYAKDDASASICKTVSFEAHDRHNVLEELVKELKAVEKA